MKDPEPEFDMTDYWMRGNRNVDRRNAKTVLLPYLCVTRRTEDLFCEWNECWTNCKICENCNFVHCCKQNGMNAIEQEKDYIWESALRFRILWEMCPDWNGSEKVHDRGSIVTG